MTWGKSVYQDGFGRVQLESNFLLHYPCQRKTTLWLIFPHHRWNLGWAIIDVPHKWNESPILWTASPTEEGRVSFFLFILLPVQVPLFLVSPGLGLGGREAGGKGTGSYSDTTVAIWLWDPLGEADIQMPILILTGTHMDETSLTLEVSIFWRTIPPPTGFQQPTPGALFWDQFTIQASPSSSGWAVQLSSAGPRSGSWETHTVVYKTTSLSKSSWIPTFRGQTWIMFQSNSPNCRKCMSTPLIGSITSYIWLKMDKHTLYTMGEGHKEQWHFYPKKTSWETLQPSVNPWHSLIKPEGGWRANASWTHFSVFTEHLTSRQLVRLMPKCEEVLEKQSNLKSNEMKTTPSYLLNSSVLLFPAPLSSRPMCNKMRNATN